MSAFVKNTSSSKMMLTLVSATKGAALSILGAVVGLLLILTQTLAYALPPPCDPADPPTTQVITIIWARHEP